MVVTPLRIINHIVRGKRGLSADTAWRLARLFGKDAPTWLQQQLAQFPRGEST